MLQADSLLKYTRMFKQKDKVQELTPLPSDPRFAGSNPAKAMVFMGDKNP
jgi:hypothetical protein